jgi:hypothetical protein
VLESVRGSTKFLVESHRFDENYFDRLKVIADNQIDDEEILLVNLFQWRLI